MHRLWGYWGVANKKNARGVGTPEWGSNPDADRTDVEAGDNPEWVVTRFFWWRGGWVGPEDTSYI